MMRRRIRLFYAAGDGVDIYKVNNTLVQRQDMPPDGSRMRSAAEGIFYRNVLVISRQLLHYRREKYPPTSPKNLSGIIANDVAELFPMISAPDFYYRPWQHSRSFSLVDIWAWPSKLLRGHAQALRCNYVIPEDALFISAEPEVTLYNQAAFDHAVAHDAKGFVGSRTFIHPLRQTDIDLFLHSLGNFRHDVKRINSCLQQKTPYPPSLAGINRVNLRPFKTTSQHSITNMPMLYRLATYAVCGYAAWAYFAIRQIDVSTASMQDKIKKANKQVTFLANLRSKDETGKLAEELQNKFGQAPNPVECLDVLAGALLDGTYVNQLNITYGGIEAALTSSDPAGVIKALNASSFVQNVQLKGEPQKDAQRLYKFRLAIGIRGSAPEASSAAVSSPRVDTAPATTTPATTTPETAIAKDKEMPKVSPGINKSSNPGVIFRGTKIF
ncbi:hypothetical protein MBAV_003141 [Candidatus Magnetobacterium bavaricum]|uniref:Fimbrial assembly family protein n=1 Tax=Candidatus Magnetobacterium bavaricum TaxID=29290 RepID=A0A0F3GS67_9BACT|nr:hypothetical protein MBAV_003141 [Candidatus Magnetobacterium bavaricum]